MWDLASSDLWNKSLEIGQTNKQTNKAKKLYKQK